MKNVLPNVAGKWLMSPPKVRELVSRMQAAGAFSAPQPGDDEGDENYSISDGVATIEICGVLTKQECWADEIFGFCPTMPLIDYLSRALADSSVKAIDLLIDTPGGMVDGTTQFAEAIAAANKIKPVAGRVSDLCASGGMWLASQCGTVYANSNAFIGSLGVYSVLTDDSKFWETMGVKFNLVSTGGIKGMGADGVITAELVADVKREIDATYELFISAVATGRGMTPDAVRALADGRCWIAAEAEELGLIDEVCSLPDAFQKIKAAAGGGGGSYQKPIAAPAMNAQRPPVVASLQADDPPAPVTQSTRTFGGSTVAAKKITADEARTQASREFKTNPLINKRWSTEERYVDFRAAELVGEIVVGNSPGVSSLEIVTSQHRFITRKVGGCTMIERRSVDAVDDEVETGAPDFDSAPATVKAEFMEVAGGDITIARRAFAKYHSNSARGLTPR